MEVPRELFDPDYEFDNTELWPDIGEVLGFEAAQEAMRECVRAEVLETPTYALRQMELAGLEPAPSWVRYGYASRARGRGLLDPNRRGRLVLPLWGRVLRASGSAQSPTVGRA